MSEKLSVQEFFQRFPSDDACLDHVMAVRFGAAALCPTCKADATFHRLANRKAYSCSYCGHHIYPCAGTIFQDSRTSLQLWFYAIYLFVTTRHGVSGKELHRAARRDQEDRLAHGPADPQADGEAPTASRCWPATSSLMRPMSAAVAPASVVAAPPARRSSWAWRSAAAG